MALTIDELKATHPDYNPSVDKQGKLKALETYRDFYSGGRNFEINKDKYLRSRPIEATPNGKVYRDNRLGCAYFTPHAGGIGDNLCGTALQYPPLIEIRDAEGDLEDNDPREDYWTDLNHNLDGHGRDTRSVAWCLMMNLICHRRAYIVVNFPDSTQPQNATFAALGAAEVDDWQMDDNGNYEWIRCHNIDLIRSKGQFAPLDTERHIWTFYTAENIVTFTAEKKIGADWPTDMPPVAGVIELHGLKVVPVFPIEVEPEFWVMDRLFSTAHAYFNREASRSFAIDTGALTLPVVKTDKDLAGMVTANGFAIHLGANTAEDFFYRSPDAGIYTALKEDCEYLLGNLYGALNQMALTAAGQQGNPRQSGTAKTADAAAIKAFLALLCDPIMAAFNKAFKAVQKYRDEEDLTILVHGMDKFDVQSIELEINRCATFNSIPGMAPAWRKESMKQAARAYLPNMDKKSWDEGEKELAENELPEVQSKEDTVVSQPNGSAPEITNSTTGRPQGFAPGQVSQQYTKGKNAGKATVATPAA
jgi:hypothetical protein